VICATHSESRHRGTLVRTGACRPGANRDLPIPSDRDLLWDAGLGDLAGRDHRPVLFAVPAKVGTKKAPPKRGK
jgi:hypothetical protein